MPEITTTTFLVLFVCFSLFAIPAALVLKRLGHHPAWALLCYVPVLALLGLWVLAFSPRTGSAA
jgi:hypothetical protein